MERLLENKLKLAEGLPARGASKYGIKKNLSRENDFPMFGSSCVDAQFQNLSLRYF